MRAGVTAELPVQQQHTKIGQVRCKRRWASGIQVRASIRKHGESTSDAPSIGEGGTFHGLTVRCHQSAVFRLDASAVQLFRAKIAVAHINIWKLWKLWNLSIDGCAPPSPLRSSGDDGKPS